MFTVPLKLLLKQRDGFMASYAENPEESRALTAGGECAQRITDMPRVEDLIGRIVKEAEDILSTLPSEVTT